MSLEAWYALVGALLLGVALFPSLLKRLPLTTAAIYLGVGVVLGPTVFNYLHFEPLKHTKVLEIVTEVAVIISLFTAGLKLRLPLTHRLWMGPLRLAFLSMTISVGLVTLVGVYLLDLPLGAAVLLGGILAPTDPVLASDVQTRHPEDADDLRFSLTGEAGFNDGTAFPFVLLGLGLLGLHDLGEWGQRWLLVDVLWSILGGLGIGALLGTLTARLVLFLRLHKHEAVGTDDFLALGLIAGSYGIALLLHTYGFLAVFAAGLALRHTERVFSESKEQAQEKACEENTLTEDSFPESEKEVEELREELATDPSRAPRFLARQVLHFNEALERIGELIMVVWLGGMLTSATWTHEVFWLAPLLFFLIRPISVMLGLSGNDVPPKSRPFIGWFGIRGIGSLYYLFYAIEHGVPKEIATQLVSLVLSVVAVSIVVHGLSGTPVMNFYERRYGKQN